MSELQDVYFVVVLRRVNKGLQDIFSDRLTANIAKRLDLTVYNFSNHC